jgi:hypothetical protein
MLVATLIFWPERVLVLELVAMLGWLAASAALLRLAAKLKYLAVMLVVLIRPEVKPLYSAGLETVQATADLLL